MILSGGIHTLSDLNLLLRYIFLNSLSKSRVIWVKLKTSTVWDWKPFVDIVCFTTGQFLFYSKRGRPKKVQESKFNQV